MPHQLQLAKRWRRQTLEKAMSEMPQTDMPHQRSCRHEKLQTREAADTHERRQCLRDTA